MLLPLRVCSLIQTAWQALGMAETDKTLLFFFSNSPYIREEKLYMEFSRILNTMLLTGALEAREGTSNLASEN